MITRSRHMILDALERYYDELLIHVRRRVGCGAMAADIIQEVGAKLTERPPETAIENPRAFLYRAASNMAIDQLRAQKTQTRYVQTGDIPEHARSDTPSVEEHLVQRERLAVLKRAVDELPPRCRDVFIMRKFHGISQAEIAEKLGISRGMVEKHIRNALAHCMEKMREIDTN
ncbi:sigma-70 family RNA polymerase sigma factor [Thalassospira lucentensis]|uniref:sigma-70 family RNA polymerase sigma factor n=1 Tax=Thalassospira lucentensis TaxID=168935 RepID=UPI003AA94D49